jgi:hypothetical protein
MRLAGKKKLGYFPLPLAEAERIRTFLQFPVSGCAAVDPCIGDGGAFRTITGDEKVIRYGIELDADRVEQALACWFWSFPEIVSGSAGGFSPSTSGIKEPTGWAPRRRRSTSRWCCSALDAHAVNVINCPTQTSPRRRT